MCTVDYFQPFDKLPGEFKPAAIQVDKFSGRSVVVKKDWKGNQYFTLNWEDLTTRVNNYQGDDLAFDKLENHSISNQKQEVQVMVDKIVEFLKTALSVVLADTEIKALAANILAAFTDLKQTESHDWASWSSEEHQSNSSWQYRLLYSVPMKDSHDKIDPDYFYTLVTTTTLTADISTKSEWWGLEKTTTKNFSADISAMELVVKRGFKNPPK